MCKTRTYLYIVYEYCSVMCVVCTPSSITSRLAVRHRRETLMPRRRRGDLSAVEQSCCCGYNILRTYS